MDKVSELDWDKTNRSYRKIPNPWQNVSLINLHKTITKFKTISIPFFPLQVNESTKMQSTIQS